MANVWMASREGGMAPVERAAVAGAVGLLLGVISFLTEEQTGPEATRLWEVPVMALSLAATGLLTAWPRWVRVPCAGLGIVAVEQGIDVLLGRPHALDSGVVVAAIIGTGLAAAVLEFADPPAALRRWGGAGGSRLGGVVGWGAFYGFNLVLQFLLWMGVIGIVQGLVHLVLPSPGLVDAAKNERGGGIVGLGAAALALVLTVQLWGRRAGSAVRLADASAWGRVRRGAALGALGTVIGAGMVAIAAGVNGLPSPAACGASEAVATLMVPAAGLFVLGLWLPARGAAAGRVRYIAAMAGAALAGWLGLYFGSFALDWVRAGAGAAAGASCGGPMFWLAVLEGGTSAGGLPGGAGAVALCVLAAAVFIPALLRGVWAKRPGEGWLQRNKGFLAACAIAVWLGLEVAGKGMGIIELLWRR